MEGFDGVSGSDNKDITFVVRRLHHLARKKSTPLYMGFVNLAKAYNSAERTLLWTVLAQFGVTKDARGYSPLPRWIASGPLTKGWGCL